MELARISKPAKPTLIRQISDKSPIRKRCAILRNPDGSYTHTEKDGEKMHFDAGGLLTSQVDRNGNTTN